MAQVKVANAIEDEPSNAAALARNVAQGTLTYVSWAGARIVNIVLTVFFPFVLMVGAYYLAPATSATISLSFDSVHAAANNPAIAWGILAQFILALCWAVFDFWPVIKGNARTGFLQVETFVSVTAGFIVYGYVLWQSAHDQLSYLMVVPLVSSLVDAIGTPILAINNAAQLSTKGRDHGSIGITPNN